MESLVESLGNINLKKALIKDLLQWEPIFMPD